MGVTSVVGLAGLGIVLALSSNSAAVRGQATPSAASASFVVQAPTMGPETNPETTWLPGVIAGEAPGAQDAGEVPPVSPAPGDPAKQPAKHSDRRDSGHPGRSEFATSRAPLPVLPPRMPGKKPDRPAPAAPAVPAARAPQGVAPASTPPGAARSSVPRPGSGEPRPEAPRPRPSSAVPGPALNAPEPRPGVAPQPGPSRLPDPCATYRDARRDYCYRVVAELTAGS